MGWKTSGRESRVSGDGSMVVVAVVAVVVRVVTVGLLGSGLLLGDLNLADTLAELDKNVTLGSVELGSATDGDGGVGIDQSDKLVADENTNGLGKVRGDGKGGVSVLLNVLSVELADQAGLDGGTADGKLAGVDGSGVG